MRGGFECGEVLEIGKKRQPDLRAHVGNLDLAHDQSQVLNRPRSAHTAIADKTRGLVVPLAEQKIEGVLERA